ncbi:MAG TPA: reverse transcriptase/maturase family protein [Candidatus Paceibacterota bacterium]|nr:reverse transcriptase/maturase family protein [Candidatus Paceibacterota bacterium]
MFNHRYKDIIKIDNLLVAWEYFLRGKKHKKDVMIFQAELTANIADLYCSLVNHTYKHGSYSAFNISDPKPRNIHKAIVRDRLLHHLIYKEFYQYFDSKFIYDSYSCREDKGTHRALNRFRYFARKVSKNDSRTCYVLKCDIKKFFASIDHKILIKTLKRHIEDSDIMWLLNEVIVSFNSVYSDVGMPLGNLTSQLLVNVYMHEFDMYLKQELRVKHYIRYADDFVILSDIKEYLNLLLPKISEFLQKKLNLILHEHKVYIKTYSSGLDFLGWIHFPHHRQLRTTTKRKIIRKLKGYPKRNTIISYRGLLGYGDTYRLRKQLNIEILDN